MRISIEEDQPPEVIDKRKHLPHAFTKGNTASVGIGRKGLTDKTISKQLMHVVEDKRAFKQKFNTVGLTRLWLCLEQLPDNDYVRCAIAILPYMLPKMASVEVRDEEGNKIHNIDDAQQVHTITIKDMRTGQQTTILSE